MGFPADRAGGARKKFWLFFPRSTPNILSNMLSIFLPFFTFYAVRPSTMCVRPFLDFLHVVDTVMIEKLTSPYFGREEFKNQDFGLI